MGATPKDRDLKVIRGYRDPKTIVWSDGREWLRGRDWTHRVLELMQRANERCEYVITASFQPRRCSNPADDPHHVVKRSVLRDDRLSNLQALCRYHHDLLDPRKVRSDKKERANGQ